VTEATGPVGVRRDGGAAWVTLRRPDVLNALDEGMKEELLEALVDVAGDGGVRVVALTGEGRAFCAGEDLRAKEQVYRSGGTPQFAEILERLYTPIVRQLADMPKPTVACLNGAAAGAGLALALACDLRVASDTAKLRLAFGGIGLIPDAGSTYFLPKLVGLAKALELALLDEPVSAADALELGLVSKVWPADAFPAEASALVGRLAAGPTTALALTRQLLRASAEGDLPAALRAESEAQERAGGTGDHREGVLAFLERRPPQYKGS
jgi:2-(1,2-epoxy-1,2-dihydrophenyl)acetyl-CoA isomerase